MILTEDLSRHRDLEEARMIAHVMRDLRRQKVANERKRRKNPSAEDTPPVVTVRELAELFPALSDGVIRSRLKDRCSCISYKVSALLTQLSLLFLRPGTICELLCWQNIQEHPKQRRPSNSLQLWPCPNLEKHWHLKRTLQPVEMSIFSTAIFHAKC